MNLRDRHVIITGGAGALGTAVTEALLAAGATCHIPCFDSAEAHRFALRAHDRVVLTVTGSLADEPAVATLYHGAVPLWASIHIAGGFAAGPLRDMSAATLRQQIDMNLVSCALCCRAALKAMTGGGRIVNVSARAGLEWRSGAGMVAYTASKAAVAALTAALAEEVAKDDIWSTPWHPRSWTRPPTAMPCRTPITRCGRRSRKSPRPSSSSPRPTTA